MILTGIGGGDFLGFAGVVSVGGYSSCKGEVFVDEAWQSRLMYWVFYLGVTHQSRWSTKTDVIG